VCGCVSQLRESDLPLDEGNLHRSHRSKFKSNPLYKGMSFLQLNFWVYAGVPLRVLQPQRYRSLEPGPRQKHTVRRKQTLLAGLLPSIRLLKTNQQTNKQTKKTPTMQLTTDILLHVWVVLQWQKRDTLKIVAEELLGLLSPLRPLVFWPFSRSKKIKRVKVWSFVP